MANNQQRNLDENGVLYLWSKVKSFVADAIKNKVDKVDGKGLSTNDLTTELKTNYDAAYTHSQQSHAPASAQANVIEGVQVNGKDVPITDKKAQVTTPTKTSDLTNDSGFITTADIPEGAAASTTVPKMNAAEGAVGAELAFARGDHIHPSDTSKLDKTGDASNNTVTFSAATTREAPATGEKLSILLGKLLKFFNDTKTVAFTGSYNDLSDKPTIPTVPAISTNIEADASNDAKTASPKAVANYVASRISSAYKAAGSVAFANLPTPSADVLGNVYNITDDFVTTASFVEGAGNTHPAGTNVAVILIDGSYKLDVMAGFVDMSGYLQVTDMVPITNAELDEICV